MELLSGRWLVVGGRWLVVGGRLFGVGGRRSVVSRNGIYVIIVEKLELFDGLAKFYALQGV